MMRNLLVGMIALLGFAAPALAQPQDWTLTRQGNSFSLAISDSTPVPTADEIMARVRQEFDWPRVTTGPIRQSQVILTTETRPERVGRLTADVVRPADANGPRTLLLARGTPVYMMIYDYRGFAPVEPGAPPYWELWCGAAPASTTADAPAGHCIRVLNNEAASVTIPQGQSPYLPQGLETFTTATMPTVNEGDRRARNEIPSVQISYELWSATASGVEVIATSRVGGVEREQMVTGARAADGSAVLRHNGIVFRLRPEGRDAFTAQLLEPDETAMREFAENLIAQINAQRAAGGN